jgi:hypothetical protein
MKKRPVPKILQLDTRATATPRSLALARPGTTPERDMEIIGSIVAMLPTQYARNKWTTPQEIPMTEPRAPKNEYLVTVRGQLETTTRIFVHSEDEARRRVVDDKWQWVYEDFEGEDGTVCEQLNRDMAMEIVKVEFICELPPPPPPPPELYHEEIVHSLLNMVEICVVKEKANYDGTKDHAYRELYAFMLTLKRMWEAKGVKAELHMQSPDELDAERAKETAL